MLLATMLVPFLSHLTFVISGTASDDQETSLQRMSSTGTASTVATNLLTVLIAFTLTDIIR